MANGPSLPGTKPFTALDTGSQLRLRCLV